MKIIVNRLKLIPLLIAICFSLVFLTACFGIVGPVYRIRSSGYFKYMVYKETGEAMLVGLTKLGMEQETIIIPSQIKGHKLAWAGYPTRVLPFWSTSYEIDFKSEKLKKLYIPSTIKLLVYGTVFYNELPNLEEFYWGSVLCNKTEYLPVGEYGEHMIFEAYQFYDKRNYCDIFKNGYVSQQHMLRNKEAYDNAYSSVGKIDYSYLTVANVVYYLSDNPEDTYFVDDCDGEKIINIPDNPVKEGYEFNGWYKEKECINKWDFEKDIVPQKEYDEAGGYIFKETSLYAKWGT